MLKIRVKNLTDILKDFIVSAEINNNSVLRSVFIDSRKVKKGSLFIALKGERFDGKDFVREAVLKGAICVVFSGPLKKGDEKFLREKKISFLEVINPVDALTAIARWNRKKSRSEFIAVTGSNGKTTTKDFIYQLFSGKFKTISSDFSYNNHIGVPLTLLKVAENTEYAVVEMGMNHKGELYELSSIVEPDIALITNIAESHLGFFKSKRDIASAKAEVFSFMSKKGLVLLNADTPYFSYLKKRAGKRKIISLGCGKNADVMIRDIKCGVKNSFFKLKFRKKIYDFKLNVPGKHNIYNAAFAIVLGFEKGLDYEYIFRKVKSFALPYMRMQIINENGIFIINDAYNANPYSVRSLLNTLSLMPVGGKKIFVFSDMLELGNFSEKYHREVGRNAYKSGVDFLLCCGKHSKFAVQEFNRISRNGRKALFYDDKKSLVKDLTSFAGKNDCVLFKASRAMKLEDVAKDYIEKLKRGN